MILYKNKSFQNFSKSNLIIRQLLESLHVAVSRLIGFNLQLAMKMGKLFEIIIFFLTRFCRH